ncbi:AGAP013154-PA-like protein [Anopheles sinensis]|uniref:AGAP013154-PA-like protein n=1 Tax=Anopheles sinensis TaxID=74873 RepID=A0A084VV41_ANOSI|nr:AGAP013154-PA-like protein [Anopheles sinensis]
MNQFKSLLYLMLLVGTRCSATSIKSWATCSYEVILRSSAAAKHQVNAYTLDPSSGFGMEVLDMLLPALENNGSYSVNLAAYPTTIDYNQRNFVLIVTDSLASFDEHLGPMIDKNVEFRGYFLLLVYSSSYDASVAKVQYILERLWDFRVHNVLLALESSSNVRDDEANGIDLVSYTPYGPGCCGCARPYIVDRCIDGRLSNGTAALFDRFERNLYGCQLRIAAFERPPFMKFSNDTPPKLSGIEGDLIELLAQKLNFTVAIVEPPDGHVWGRIYPNGTTNGAMKLLMEGRVHLTLGRYFPYPRLLANTTQSHSYYIADLVLAVPEALVPVTPLEQLLKPFRWKIWLMLALELVLGFGALFVLTCVIPPAFHYPRRIALDYWRTFLGESLPILPRVARTRFMLMLWILHTMLLRECYKGALVGFLTEPTPLNDIHSIDALLDAGYRFAMTETVYHKVFHESSKIDHRLVLVEPADGQYLLQRTLQLGERLAIANTREEIALFNGRNRSIINYRTSDEKLLTFHFCMYFKRSSPVVTAFDWYIRRILATGYITRWYTTSVDTQFLRPTLANSGQAEVLSMRHLQGCYVLLLAGLIVSAFTFTLELLCFQRPMKAVKSTGGIFLD